MAATDKISSLLASKIKGLAEKLIPTIFQIALKIGIENLGTPNIKYPDTCLQPTELNKLIKLRNTLVVTLNTTAKAIQLLALPLRTLGIAVGVASTSLSTVKSIRLASNVALAAIPPPGVPGTLPAAINILKDVEDPLKGKINGIKNKVNAISNILDFVYTILVGIIALLKSLDVYFKRCAPNEVLTPISDSLIEIENQYNQAQADAAAANTLTPVYQGFTLGIVEEQFSPTVKKIKAVARNKDGIILLQTPSSFTTIPQILIAELKLIIDNSDLKAN
jgi:hypothetical protein